VLAPALVDDALEVVRLGLRRVELGGRPEGIARVGDAGHLVEDPAAQQVVRGFLGEPADRAVDVAEGVLELPGVERLARLVVGDLRAGLVEAVARLAAHLLRVQRAVAAGERRGHGDEGGEDACVHGERHGFSSLAGGGSPGRSGSGSGSYGR
jgi:hypothetical protein